MDLTILGKRAGRAVASNSPALLTALGVTGSLTTAYLAAKAAYKAAEVIREAEREKLANRSMDDIPEGEVNEPKVSFTIQEKTELVWKLFVPAAGMAAVTIGSIIFANRITTKRAAAFASAYTVVQKGFEEYKSKVVETIGEKKEEAIRDKIAEEKIANSPLNHADISMAGSGGTWCRDAWSGRFFKSDMETLRAAVNDFNEKILHDGYASLSELWDLLNLAPTLNSDYVGWSSDKKLEPEYSWGTTNTGERCLSFGFKNYPTEGFNSAY